MMKKLQIKFITITMLAVIIITGTIVGLIIAESYRTTNGQTDTILNLIVENEGTIPEYKSRNGEFANYITMETEFSTRYFTVTINEKEEVLESNMENIAMITKDDLQTIVNEIISLNEESGYYENFKYQIVEKGSDEMIIFLDCTMQINSLKSMIKESIIIMISGWIVVFVVITLLSKKILTPIVQNSEKQKQFITNASHELKTPLAVITADVDVLEMTFEENNEWVESIKNQTNRLNTLVKSLLSLSNIEEGKNKINISQFSLTEVVNTEISDFKSLLQNKKVEFDPQNEILMNADENLIQQLVRILLDNSIKYTPDNGVIRIVLANQGKNTVIEISNTSENTRSINTTKIFDRFYREDKSRNKKTEGYGIGLSIAKSIVDMHKGKISVGINKEEMICFKIVI